MSYERIKRLIAAQGKLRVIEMDDGSIAERQGGSVSWRNNNPGNLKFEFVGSADKTVKTARTRERAIRDAKTFYQGVVDLDQWGNVIFESYEAGRAAKIHLLEKKHGDKTVEEMLLSYSTADYTGSTHHRAQADFIYRQAGRSGIDLRDKTISQMDPLELAALADGIKGFEGWKVGETRQLAAADQRRYVGAGEAVPAMLPTHQETNHHQESSVQHGIASGPARTASARSGEPHHGAHGQQTQTLQSSLGSLGYHDSHGHRLAADGTFGPNTEYAIKSFQHAHGLHADGIVGAKTVAAFERARESPLLSERTHPQHALYLQALDGVQALPGHAIGSQAHQRNAAGALTVAAHAAGLRSIDTVVVGTDGVRLFAVQGLIENPAHRRASVDRVDAIATPMDRSATELQRPIVMQPPVQVASPSRFDQQLEQLARQGMPLGMGL